MVFQSISQYIQNLIRNGELRADRLEFPADHVICEPNDPTSHFHLIESGQVRTFHVTTDGTPRLLDILGPGDWVGTASIGSMPNYQKRAVTVTPAVLTALATVDFHRSLLKHPDLALLLIQALAIRLHRSWMLGSELAGEDTTLRLIKTLLRYSTSPAARSDGEGVVLKITHAQLAQAVGAARETVSVCLTDLRLRKLVRTGRNRLHFKPDELRQINDDIARKV